MDLLKPSYASGYAKNASQSAHPNLWDGLVGAWMPSLGVTGETLRDVSGNGNHLSVTDDHPSTSNWTTSKLGTSFRFERTTSTVADYAASSKYLGISGSGGWSIQMMLKVASGLPTVSWLLWVGGRPLDDQLLSIGAVSNNYHVAHIANDYSFAPIGYNNWEQIAVTFDGTTERFYLNGVQVANRTTSLDIVDGPLYLNIREGTRDSSEYEMSSTLVHNRALSPQEIKQLYVDSLAPFRKKQRVSVAVPAAVAPSATYHPLRSLAHPLEQ